jgi:alkylated DNA repair dioxygenase AlkB
MNAQIPIAENSSYLISNNGQVFSTKTRKFLSQRLSNGYYTVTIPSEKNKKNPRRIHRLVAEAFVPNPENRKLVNHIDGNKLNNNYSNLEWVNSRQNAQHAVEMALSVPKHTSAVIQFNQMGVQVGNFSSIAEASRQTGVSKDMISHCCGKRTKSTKDNEGNIFIWKHAISLSNKQSSPQNGQTIPGFENYVITPEGKIFCASRSSFVKTRVNNDGYEIVCLFNKIKKNFLVHRLVAQVFLCNNDNKPTVNHKDSNKLNNAVENLEYFTYSEQNAHCIENGKRRAFCKKVYKIDQNKRVVAEYFSVGKASRDNNIPRPTIQGACEGRIHIAHGYIWKYDIDEKYEWKKDAQPIEKIDSKVARVYTSNTNMNNVDVFVDVDDCHVVVARKWINQNYASHLFDKLSKIVEWERQNLVIYGKSVPEPRKTYAMGNDGLVHKYTGISRIVKPWVKSVKKLRDRIEHETGFAANSCLMNFYETQNDWLGWHADKETTPPQHIVVTVSLGATRDILFRPKDKNRKKKDTMKISLISGDACMMWGETQKLWEHTIPKRKSCGPRIALTFRELRPSTIPKSITASAEPTNKKSNDTSRPSAQTVEIEILPVPITQLPKEKNKDSCKANMDATSKPFFPVRPSRFTKPPPQLAKLGSFPEAQDYAEAFEKVVSSTPIPAVHTLDQIGGKLKYRPNQKFKASSYHNGQRKLFDVELKFLTRFYEPDQDVFVVYAGSSPGLHMWKLHERFPQVTFLMVDPTPCAIRVHPNTNSHLHSATAHPGIVYLSSAVKDDKLVWSIEKTVVGHNGYQDTTYTPKITPRKKVGEGMTTEDAAFCFFRQAAKGKLCILEQPFTTQLAKIIQEAAEKKSVKNLYFWSDVRTNLDNTDHPGDMDIIWNLAQQYNWVHTLKPSAYMLKFRVPYWNSMKPEEVLSKTMMPPYSDDLLLCTERGLDFSLEDMPYMSGEIWLQPFGRIMTGETRLVGTWQDAQTIATYNIHDYEDIMFYHKKLERPFQLHENPYTDPEGGYDMCGDCSLEASIWQEYKTKVDPDLDIDSAVRSLGEYTRSDLFKCGHGHLFEPFSKTKYEALQYEEPDTKQFVTRGAQQHPLHPQHSQHSQHSQPSQIPPLPPRKSKYMPWQ